jgi:hypothetical protein
MFSNLLGSYGSSLPSISTITISLVTLHTLRFRSEGHEDRPSCSVRFGPARATRSPFCGDLPSDLVAVPDFSREEFFAEAVAEAEVLPGGFGDEGGVFAFVWGQIGADAGVGGVGAPLAAGVAEGAEGGGVAAGFGGEVPVEAEHVGPLAQVEVSEAGGGAEVPCGADHLADVLLDDEGCGRWGWCGSRALCSGGR